MAKEGAGKGIKGIISTICLVIITAVIVLFAAQLMWKEEEPSVSSEYIKGKLEKSSELTTAELTYTGMTKYKDSGIPFLTKGGFTMVYRAKARAGIELDKVDVQVDETNKVVHLTIPKAKALDVKIDPAEIQYFDEKFVLINVNEKEDANKAQELAEESAMKEIKNMGVLELADNQAEAVVKGLLEGVAEGYTFEVTRK